MTTAKEQARFILSAQSTVWLIIGIMITLVVLTWVNWGNIDDL